jgi:hypothetical protein
VVWLLLGACAAPPRPPPAIDNTPTPEGRALQGAKLAGPYASIDAACRAASPCGAHPDCGVLAHTSADLDHGDARIAPLACAAPDGHGARAEYYAYVKRDDGWWRSRPLFATAYHDHDCDAPLAATWEVHAPTVVARVSAAVECIACEKHGVRRSTTDLLIAVDPTGAAPLVWGPLEVGHHYRTALNDDVAAGGCTPEQRDGSLTATWPAPDLLDLSGPPRLRTPEVEGGIFYLDDDFGSAKAAPSAVGRWQLAR